MTDILSPNWSPTDASNNQAAPLGWTVGSMLPSQVEPTAQMMMGATKRLWERNNAIITTTGSAGTFVYTPTNTSYPIAYTDGETYVLKAHQAAAGGDVFNVNGLGAKGFYKFTSTGFTAVSANDWPAGAYLMVEYDSTLNSSAGGFQVLSALVPPSASTLATEIINGVYNGACRVGARADAGITVNVPTAGTFAYGGVDLIQCGVNGTSAAVSAGTITRQSGNAFGSSGYSCQITGLTATNANATINYKYRIEAKDAVALVGKTVVVQAIVKQNTGGTLNYLITLNYANSADNFSAVTQIGQSGNIAVLTGTATQISYSLSAGASAGNGLEIVISSITGAVTTKNFDLTDLGIFQGTTFVSPFPMPPYGDDLAHCKRYLGRFFSSATENETYGPGFVQSTGTCFFCLPLNVTMRVPGTGILVATAANYSVFERSDGLVTSLTSIAFQSNGSNIRPSPDSVTILVTKSASFSTPGDPAFFGASASGASYLLVTGAEL